MPRLILFVPCDKVLIDQDGRTSLIALWDTVTLGVASNMDVPRELVIPVRWSIVSLWERTPEDGDTTYEQRTYLRLPDGEIQGETTHTFTMTQRRHQTVANASNFPVGQGGDLQIVLEIREVGQDEWRPVSEYTITVTYKSSEEDDADEE
ncbi:MAG: hypothetical protein M3R24_40600 [Chloroflexota bacterium]|nr:hypothetical protein [Chloroflexota bacterium]